MASDEVARAMVEDRLKVETGRVLGDAFQNATAGDEVRIVIEFGETRHVPVLASPQASISSDGIGVWKPIQSH
jgi:hypothetical protein